MGGRACNHENKSYKLQLGQAQDALQSSLLYSSNAYSTFGLPKGIGSLHVIHFQVFLIDNIENT